MNVNVCKNNSLDNHLAMFSSTVKKNIAANFAGKAWTSIMGLVFIPVYIKLLGIEAYGLIGLFASLLALLSILDMGLGSTLSRELAWLSAFGENNRESRNLIRTFEYVYWGVGIIIGLGLTSLAPIVAQQWLDPQGMSSETVEHSLRIMGIVIAIQWPASLYAGGLTGLQKQVILNGIRGTMATIQHAGAVLVLMFISPTIVAYFLWQIAVNFLQTLILVFFVWRALPATGQSGMFQKELLRKNSSFAVGMMSISIVTTILTQADKIILSKLLPLALFGYYTLASNIANNVVQLASPVFNALFPRFSQLVSKQTDLTAIAKLYHKGAQLVSLVVLPVAMTVAFFAEEILALWLRDPEVTQHTYILLRLLLIGSSLNALLIIPYTLQIAYGWTKLVLYQNLISVLLLIPLMIFMTTQFGAEGAAIVWIILNAGYVFILIPIMHKRLLTTELWRWYSVDVGLPLLMILGVITISRVSLPQGLSSYVTIPWILLTLIISSLLSALSLPYARTWLQRNVFRHTW